MQTSLDAYFSNPFEYGLVLHGISLKSIPEQGDFCAQTFHKVV